MHRAWRWHPCRRRAGDREKPSRIPPRVPKPRFQSPTLLTFLPSLQLSKPYQQKRRNLATIDPPVPLHPLIVPSSLTAAWLQAAQIGPLLKTYQQEIDSLTSRAKFAEGAFLGIYKHLLEALDPAPVLLAAKADAEELQGLRTKCGKLEIEVSEYQEEFTELRSQDVTVKRLEDQIAEMRDAAADSSAAAVEKAREGWQEEARMGEKAWLQKEHAMLAQLEAANAAVAAAQKGHQSSAAKLLDATSQLETDEAAMQSQLDLVAAELERWRHEPYIVHDMAWHGAPGLTGHSMSCAPCIMNERT